MAERVLLRRRYFAIPLIGAVSLLILDASFAGSKAKADQRRYGCFVKVGLPHDSGHVRGTMNVEAFGTCQGNVPISIDIYVQLQLVNVDTGEVVGSSSDTVPVAVGQKNVLVTNVGTDYCEPGKYQGTFYATATPPPDFDVTVASSEGAGAVGQINCPNGSL